MPSVNTPRQVLFASLIGTTIEFFDFYIYATAAVLAFPRLFFPASDPSAAMLASLATFGIAFLARPVGSALFGHFGDRIGPQDDIGHRTVDHGSIHCRDWRAPDIQHHRRRRAAASGALPLWTGAGSGRRMGRSRAAGHRECASKETCLVWHVPAAWGADRVLPFGWRLSAALPLAHRPAIPGLRLAPSVPVECFAGVPWPLCASHDYRDSRIPASPHSGPTNEGTDTDGFS